MSVKSNQMPPPQALFSVILNEEGSKKEPFDFKTSSASHWWCDLDKLPNLSGLQSPQVKC